MLWMQMTGLPYRRRSLHICISTAGWTSSPPWNWMSTFPLSSTSLTNLTKCMCNTHYKCTPDLGRLWRCGITTTYVTRPVLFIFFSWLLAGNSYMVTLWWCLTYMLVYLLVTRPPLTILMWPLESRWLFTNTCLFLAVMWTCWVSSTSPSLIYSSAWLVPHHALTNLSIVFCDVYVY